MLFTISSSNLIKLHAKKLRENKEKTQPNFVGSAGIQLGGAFIT